MAQIALLAFIFHLRGCLEFKKILKNNGPGPIMDLEMSKTLAFLG